MDMRRPAGKDHSHLHRAGVTEAVMAGGIRKVKLFGNFRPDLRGARFWRVKGRDDDALLRAAWQMSWRTKASRLWIRLLFVANYSGAGVLTKRIPSAAHWEDIRYGFRIAKEIGRLGIGQTVVVKNRVVVAVEAVEGTDDTIQRGGRLAKSGYVVVKVSKPEQDLRFDVPAVGIETIQNIHDAGGAVLAVEAGKTIFLENRCSCRRPKPAGYRWLPSKSD
jgi:DUF1009 family protein